ncbi:MAG: AI-2E family transporter [bacterium]
MTHSWTFVALTVLVTLAFGWVLWPLFGAVFWAVAFVIVLDPLARRLTDRLGHRRNLASLIMILGFVLLIILPTMVIVSAVVREAADLIDAAKSGKIDLHEMFTSLINVLPGWTKWILQQLGLGDLSAVQASVSTSVGDWIGANAPVVLSFGQTTMGVVVGLGVMLYLMFFLFRDGDAILARLKAAIPMDAAVLNDLLRTFTLVVRATVRGDILVALLQGCLGGLAFWVLGIPAVILWTVLMSFLSLFPVFGAALVWGPAAVFLLASGMIWQGIALILYGTLVISLIDNIARPWLVGQATRMPDYVVLISTLGGIATFGMQGFITGPVVAAMFIAVWTTFLAQPRT